MLLRLARAARVHRIDSQITSYQESLMPKPETMTHKVVENRLMICVHNAKAPKQSEWAAYVEDLRRLPLEQACQIVLTTGGAPSASQRKDITDLTTGRQHRVAVVTPSAMVRGVVTALNWFNPKVQAFPPERARAAFDYLAVNEMDTRMLFMELRLLCEALGDIPKEAIPVAM
jgi:hypothetical protein